MAEERAAEAEYLAELIFELDLTGDSSIISQQVAGRLRQLSHADLLTISYGTRLRGVQVVILSGDAPPQLEVLHQQRVQRATAAFYGNASLRETLTLLTTTKAARQGQR